MTQPLSEQVSDALTSALPTSKSPIPQSLNLNKPCPRRKCRVNHSLRSIGYAVRSTQYAVPSTQYSVLSTQYSVPGTRYPGLSTQYSVLSTQLVQSAQSLNSTIATIRLVAIRYFKPICDSQTYSFRQARPKNGHFGTPPQQFEL